MNVTSLLKVFDEELSATLSDDPVSFWRCEPIFTRLLASGFTGPLVDVALSRIVEQPLGVPGIRDEYLWRLFDRPRFTLALMGARAEGAPMTELLHGSPRHRLFGALGPHALRLDRYRHDDDHRGDLFDRSARPTRKGEEDLAPGNHLRLEAFRDIVEIRPAAEVRIALVLSSAPVHTIRWSYDRATLEPLECATSTLNANHLSNAAWALVQLGHPRAAEAIAGLYEHPAHYLRWTAVRAVMEVDPERGMDLLQRAASDPHPHVRLAAQRALSRLR
jgi:hypothetical protein